jgi:hypothetical protein
MTEKRLRKCKYCKHLLINLASTTQTCWLLKCKVDVEGVCEDFEFSVIRYKNLHGEEGLELKERV